MRGTVTLTVIAFAIGATLLILAIGSFLTQFFLPCLPMGDVVMGILLGNGRTAWAEDAPWMAPSARYYVRASLSSWWVIAAASTAILFLGWRGRKRLRADA